TVALQVAAAIISSSGGPGLPSATYRVSVVGSTATALGALARATLDSGGCGSQPALLLTLHLPVSIRSRTPGPPKFTPLSITYAVWRAASIAAPASWWLGASDAAGAAAGRHPVGCSSVHACSPITATAPSTP